jgi:60 kDa SS-A/Ro ribonucleoprotein
MLRNYCQIVRSGVFGWQAFPQHVRRLIKQWLEARDTSYLFRQSVGKKPSLADIIKMIHPRPDTGERAALYSYLVGKQNNIEDLPSIIKAWEEFKRKPTGPAPNVPFQMLSSLDIGPDTWKEIARKAHWQMTRMNINTFQRHGVFDDPELVQIVADRLRNKDLIEQARAFPYQLYAAYKNTHDVPRKIKNALQAAADIALDNVPEFDAELIVVAPDVSGSMSAPITGYRGTATTNVCCVDVAALIASAIARKNPDRTIILPVDTNVHPDNGINPLDSIVTNTRRLAAYCGGGTALGTVPAYINREGLKPDAVILISDNESWCDRYGGRATAYEKEWLKLKRRHKKAIQILIDLNPFSSAQASNRKGILKVGGFSDKVFDVMRLFIASGGGNGFWTRLIESDAVGITSC